MNRHSLRILAFVAVAWLAWGERARAEEPKLVQPTEVRKLVADGKHNAFTALAKFKNDYFLAFRSAKNHNSQDGDIIVMRSSDGKEWTEAKRIDIVPDDRDPQFLVTDKRLMLYDAAMKGPLLVTFLTYTEDGKTWSEPQAVYEPTFIVWKPIRHGDLFYCGAHKKDEVSGGKGRQVHFIVSKDGISWEKLSTIRAGNWESETTVHFLKDGTALGYLRQKYGSPKAQVYESKAPYKEWTLRPDKWTHLSGHAVRNIGGVDYLFSRTIGEGGKTGCMIYTLDANGIGTPYCALPAGGDCSYAEAVEFGNEMLVSYYSSHEGSTNIYLARVPLKK